MFLDRTGVILLLAFPGAVSFCLTGGYAILVSTGIGTDPGKSAETRSAGKPHAACDVAGAGNGLTVRLVRHYHRKRGETDRPRLRSTAPALALPRSGSRRRPKLESTMPVGAEGKGVKTKSFTGCGQAEGSCVLRARGCPRGRPGREERRNGAARLPIGRSGPPGRTCHGNGPVGSPA